MARETALWFPFWYELDQAIAVGSIAEFDFFHAAPVDIPAAGHPVFFRGDWNEKAQYYSSRRKVVSIYHGQLGQLRRVDTDGLDYRFTTMGGEVWVVNAEEAPGRVEEGRIDQIQEWSLWVTLESA
jgi:hypothetical protein